MMPPGAEEMVGGRVIPGPALANARAELVPGNWPEI